MMLTWKLWSGNVNGDAADENMLQGKLDAEYVAGHSWLHNDGLAEPGGEQN